MPEQDHLSVSYRMTPGELLRASRRVHPPLLYYYSRLRQIVAYLSLSGIIFLSSCWISRVLFEGCQFYFFMPVALIVSIFYVDAWIIRRSTSHQEARSPAYGPHRMSISSDGLVDETPATRHFYKWSGIERIEVDHLSIYIVLDYPKLYMVSKRSFASQDEADAFCGALLQYYE